MNVGSAAGMSNMDENREDPRVDTAKPQDRSTRATRFISRATGALGSFPMILLAVPLVASWLVGGLLVLVAVG
jgi:hypothetical protein